MTGDMDTDGQGLRDCVHPGAAPALVDALFSYAKTKRLPLLRSIYQKVLRETPQLAEDSGFSVAFQALTSLPAPVIVRISQHPSFGGYCGVTTRLICRGAHTRLGAGEIVAQLGRLGGFSLAGALLANQESAGLCRVDWKGRVPLPALERVVELPLRYAGRLARYHTSPPGFRLVFAGSEVNLSLDGPNPGAGGSDAVRVRPLSRLAGRFELDDSNELLWRDGGVVASAALSDADTVAWMEIMDRAWTLLERIDPASAREIERHVTTVAPLPGATSGEGDSSTVEGDWTCGAIRMPLASSPEGQLEALIHQYHQSKFHALSDVERLIEKSSRDKLSYSPWHDRPRPMGEILRDIFAFGAVARLWNAALRQDPRGALADRAAVESDRRRREALRPARELLASGALTAAGRIVLEEMVQLLRSGERLEPLDDSSRHRLRWEENRTRFTYQRPGLLDAWRSAGGPLRDPSPTPKWIVPEGAEGQQVCAQLGTPDGIAVNRAEDSASRLDKTIDTLGRLHVLDRTSYDQLAALVRGAADGTFKELMSGHLAYLDEQPALAARHYANALEVVPDDLDTWRSLAFCLRHLGLFEEAGAFLFHPNTTAELGARCLLVQSVLDHLLNGQSMLPQEIADHRPLAGRTLLLRWIAKELDRG